MAWNLGLLGAASFVEAAGAFDLLETQILASDSSSVTFTGLGSYSDYNHLQIRSLQRSTNSLNNLSNVDLRFNSDTGSNYSMHWLEGDGSSVYSTGFSSQTLIAISRSLPRDGTTSNSFGASVIDILDFSSSNKNTTIRVLAGVHTATRFNIALTSGSWINTNPVTQITLTPSLADFLAGSRFSLYGVK